MSQYLSIRIGCLNSTFVFCALSVNPIALRMVKTLWSFGLAECNRVNRQFGGTLFTEISNIYKRMVIFSCTSLTLHCNLFCCCVVAVDLWDCLWMVIQGDSDGRFYDLVDILSE